MRILMLNYEFPPIGGGGGVGSKKIAEGFVERGHDVDFVTTWVPGLKRKETVDGINVYRVRVAGRSDLHTATMSSMFSYLISGFFKCSQLCSRKDYDFINTHFAVPTGPLGMAVSKMFDIENILTIIGGDIYDPTKETSPHKNKYLRHVVRNVLDHSDDIVAISSDTKNNAIQYYDTNKNINVIRYPYESFEFQEISKDKLDLDKEKKYLISIGRLVKRKGYRYLIKSMQFIKDQSVECLILGDGPEKDYLKKFAKKIGVSDRVNFLGYITGEKKFQYLQNSDIYVLSSIHEGLGIVLQEAMQVGLPIVSTNHGGQVDLIDDEKNGFLIPPRDEKALANKVKRLLKDKEARQEMGRKNKKKIKEFKPSKVVKKYLEVMESGGS
ncbi:1,2-diacylglycerol 3-glucosyltransferase [candidate division MSBL1 archaeon SCGC-AAA259I09]|uniref:1,2-diacylglycerol 3-glucosyltransferase n=1 Tax=candidate division MSBL1 archaeon SCGC-AAA259I09 TaxID=1698267 RepID=A0A133USJ0_9EURY|nr:1,2-diacylglycerol 3-glucosyltransferase [candidate division MSBL1 archaeon SCGC-AAA259I09]